MSTLKVNSIESRTGDTITIPSGNKLSGAAGTISTPKSVIQVVSTTVQAQTTTTSQNTFAATSTAATITPTSATSKVLVLVSSGLFWLNGSGGGSATIYRY